MNFYKKYILPRYLNLMMGKREFEKERSAVVGQASGIVLEIGFGSGLNLPFYKNIEKLYALEPSVELFTLAKERIEKVNFPVESIVAGAEKIPLGDNSCDSVLSTFTLCSIPDVQIALGEVSRVLKPRGKFFFLEHGKSPNKFMGFLQKVFTPFSKTFAGGCHLDRDIEKIIQNSGLEFESLEKFKLRSLLFSYLYVYKGVTVKK